MDAPPEDPEEELDEEELDEEELEDDELEEEELLDDGICGMLLEDCCDCCVDSQALSNIAVTLRPNRILVRDTFIFTDSNRNSQNFEFTVLKTGARHHYCASDARLSIS